MITWTYKQIAARAGRKLVSWRAGFQSAIASEAGRGDSIAPATIRFHARPERVAVAMTTEERRSQFEAEALPHLDAVFRYAQALAGDPTRAEDLTQETMFKAFRAWDQFRPGSNARAWLLTILRNTFINEYRRRQHEGDPVDVAAIEPYTVFGDVQDVDPEGRFFSNIVDEEVFRAIRTLPVDFREVLLLSDVEGLSYGEIAELVGVPIGTVKSRLFRARHALQHQLYEYAVEMGYVKRRAP